VCEPLRVPTIPSPLSTPHSNPARRNHVADDAQDHPLPNCSSHTPRMPRPYPLRPKRNPRLAAMEGIATQSPRCHPAHRTTIAPYPIASAGDHSAISFFPFYALAPLGSSDARVLPILCASPSQILQCSSMRWKTPLWALKSEHHASLKHKQTWFTK
jgi:hypothetical protein